MLLEKIRQQIENFVLKTKDEEFSFTISIGTTHINNKSKIKDINVELKKADEMLYQAKTTGKNKIISFKNN